MLQETTETLSWGLISRQVRHTTYCDHAATQIGRIKRISNKKQVFKGITFNEQIHHIVYKMQIITTVEKIHNLQSFV